MDPSASFPSSSNSQGSRSDLIRNAVLFLNDPKVQTSSLTSRIQFLESKGLAQEEIEEALSLAKGSSSSQHQQQPRSSSTYQSQGYTAAQYGAQRPEVPGRDWRDMFIMAVVSGGVVYGVAALARKYLLPHLQPPSSTAFQSTSSALTAQYDEAARLLTELSDQTTKLAEGIEGDRERVNGVVGEVEDALKLVKDGEERWREEMREMREEVESLRSLVPKMIEKHAASQSSSLTDLQAELRSLKTLLQSRQSVQTEPQSGSSNGVSSTQQAANALLGKAKASIPAWQMAPDESTKDTGAEGL